MLTKKTKFVIAVAIQLVIILSIVVFKIVVLRGGSEVLLKINSIIIENNLGNNKLIILYEISNIPSYFFKYSPIIEGDTVYITLRQSNKYWIASSDISRTKPIDEEKIFIKGQIKNEIKDQNSASYDRKFYVVYGIENHFIPEGIDNNFDFEGKEKAARVRIDKEGNPVLKQIYVNNKPWP